MISAKRMEHALYALNGVLIQVRFMAQSGNDAGDIADILDRAEQLPRLIAAAEDCTETFGVTLSELAVRYPDFRFVVDRFEQNAKPNW